QIFDDFHGRIRTASQHVEIGLAVHPENADVAHWLCRAWMAAAVESGCVAAEEVARHEHFERTLLAIRSRFHAFDRSFLDNVEVLGRIAFTKDEVVFSVPGL